MIFAFKTNWKDRMIIPCLALLLFFAACQGSESSQKYDRLVGDIAFDSKLDQANFELCNGDANVKQYFNMGYGLQFEGEKKAIDTKFHQTYKPVMGKNQNGWLRIRFIVNCKGEADRYRVLEADENYQPFKFDKKISAQLRETTKKLKGWKAMRHKDTPVDYYQYLLFKIEDGQITEILP